MGSSDNTRDGLASQSHRYRMPGQPLLNQHQVGGASRGPDGPSACQSPPGADQEGGDGGRDGQPTPATATLPWAPRTPPPPRVCL